MTEDQIKQIQDRVEEIEKSPDLICYNCNGNGGIQISEDDADPCRCCLMTGKCYSNEQVAELLSMCRSLLEERQRGLILSIQVKEVRNIGFREGIDAAIMAVTSVRGGSDAIGRVLQAIRALLPGAQTSSHDKEISESLDREEIDEKLTDLHSKFLDLDRT